MASNTNLECVPELTSVNECFQVDALSKRSKERGYNFFVNGYIHSISTFSRTDSDSVDIRGRCYRSMRKTETPHTLNLSLSSVGKVTESHCSCVAGMSGTCAHIVGLVFTILHYQQLGLKEAPCELSCTSLPQQWHQPRCHKISPVAISSMTFAKPKATRKRRPVVIQAPNSSVTVSSDECIKQLRSDPDLPLSYLLEKIETQSTPHGTFQRGFLLPYHLQHHVHVQPNIHATSTSCGDVLFPRQTNIELEEKFQCLKEKYDISLKVARNLDKKTVRQSNSEVWYQERSKRLAASNFGKICKRRKDVGEVFLKSIY